MPTMTPPLTPEEQIAIDADLKGFEAYCIRCINQVPVKGTGDYIRLAHAYLAWLNAKADVSFGKALHDFKTVK
jgi:hypothetical protein